MRKTLILLILSQLLVNCKCDDPILIDLGPIPGRILSQVPYENGQTYRFKHSGGLVIDFLTSRVSHEEYLWCSRCCDKFSYKYQVNETTLHPDYPVFDFHIQLSGFDTVNYHPCASIGRSIFILPVLNSSSIENGQADSILMGGKWYYGVHAVKNSNEPMFNRDSIYADSLFYNSGSGIIRVVMTNGEYYQRHE